MDFLARHTIKSDILKGGKGRMAKRNFLISVNGRKDETSIFRAPASAPPCRTKNYSPTSMDGEMKNEFVR